MSKTQNILRFLARLSLGLTFLVSGSLKMIDLGPFVDSIISYALLPADFVLPVAVTLVLLEVVVGLMIMLNIYEKAAVTTSVVMMVGFLSFVLWSVLGKKDWFCQCFGSLLGEKISLSTLWRDSIFLGIAIFVYLRPTEMFTFDKLSKSRQRVVIAVLCLLGLTFAGYTNLMQVYHIPLKVGDVMPTLSLKTVEGEQIDLKSYAEPYVMIVFFSTEDCQSCLEEGFMWSRIATEYAGRVKVVGIGTSDREVILRAYMKHKQVEFPVYYDPVKKFATEFSISTPSRVLLNQQNKVIRIDRSYGSESYQNEFIAYLNELTANPVMQLQ